MNVNLLLICMIKKRIFNKTVIIIGGQETTIEIRLALMLYSCGMFIWKLLKPGVIDGLIYLTVIYRTVIKDQGKSVSRTTLLMKIFSGSWLENDLENARSCARSWKILLDCPWIYLNSNYYDNKEFGNL